MAVIDLDLARPSGDGDRARAGRARRHGLVLLIGLLVLAVIGPVQVRTSLVHSWRADAYRGYFWLDDDSVYTLANSEIGLRLMAYQLRTGVPRWARALDGPLAETYRDEQALLLPRFPPRPGLRAVTRVQEATSGRLLGTYPVPAMPLAFFADDVAVVIDRDPGASATGAGPDLPWFDGWGEEHRVSGIDLATGTTRWQATIEPGSFWALPGLRPWIEGLAGTRAAAPWMAVIGPDKLAQVWDLATGEVTAHGRLLTVDNDWSYVVALPDVLVVNTEEGVDQVLTGYDPRTLAVSWRLPVSEVPDSAAWPVTCVPMVCMTSEYGLWAIDPGSGRLVWQQPAVDVYTAGDQLLASASIDEQALLDVTTGQRRPLAPWRIVDRHPRPGPLVVARTEGGGRVQVGLVTGGPGWVRTLGEIDLTAPGACRANGTHIACADRGEVRVWRIRR